MDNKSKSAKKRVCLFCRASYKAMAHTDDFLKDQLDVMKLINKCTDWDYTSIYYEFEGSTRNYENMISDCKSGKIDIILTWSIDQFGNGLKDTAATAIMLAELDPPVEIRFVKENLSSLDPGVQEIFGKIIGSAFIDMNTGQRIRNHKNTFYDFRDELMKTDR